MILWHLLAVLCSDKQLRLQDHSCIQLPLVPLCWTIHHPNRLNIQLYYPHGSWRHQLASDPACKRPEPTSGRGTIVLLPRTADASCPTAQCYDTGRVSPLPVLLGHPSSNYWMATHCPVWSADGNFTGFSIRLDIPSHFVQHTVFALGLQPPLPLPALPPIKSSNLGIGEAKQASFNTAGLTGIVR